MRYWVVTLLLALSAVMPVDRSSNSQSRLCVQWHGGSAGRWKLRVAHLLLQRRLGVWLWLQPVSL